MILETLSTINAMWDTTFPTVKAVWDAGTPTGRVESDDDCLDGIAEGLQQVMEEMDPRPAAKERPEPTRSEQREHIHTGVLQDKLFMRRRQAMVEQAEFNGRFQAAMNDLYDVASRVR